MSHTLNTVEDLEQENIKLLEELEVSYQNLELVVEQASKEKEIAYRELQDNFEALQRSYEEISNKENLLVHLEKLSSIGQFITEIIHELKNPLTIISAHAEMALMMDPPAELQEQLRQISKQVMRLSGYLNRFRSMAYKSQEDFVLFDVNKNLIESMSTIEMIIPKGIKLQKEIFELPLMIKGDQYQINQIFLNLAKNAFDAMKTNGNLLRVSSKVVLLDWVETGGNVGKHYCLSPAKWNRLLTEHKQFVLIEFEDNGPGIDEENLDNIFQAFFTTKDRDKGTGLGLSISSDIVKRHDANLAVLSQPGIGTRFQIIFPMIDKENMYEDIILRTSTMVGM